MAGPQPTVIGTISGDLINSTGSSAGVTGFVTAGEDVINSFGGNDIIEGGSGNNTVFMGDGADTFTWRSGDGIDFVFGGNDIDTLRFNASDAFTIIDVGTDGPAVFGEEEFAAVVATVAGSVAIEEVDRIEINTGREGHLVRIDELDGTRVGKVAIHLAAAGDASGNGLADAVLVGDAGGNDQITVASIGSAVRVTGLAAEVTVDHMDAGKDELIILGSDGNDSVDALQLKAGSMVLSLFGGDGNDTLIGGASAARLFGGNGEGPDSGIDTASYSASNAGINVNLLTGKGSGGHASGDTLLEIENLVGSAFADNLTGDAETNVLDGRDGNDTLTGGGGADRLLAGDGVDTASYATSAAAVNVNLATGIGRGGDANGDTFASIESLVGSALGDALAGNGASNTLDGRGGADIMNAGAGNDTYVVDNAGDKVIETAGGGIDTVVSTIALVLGAEVENLRLIGPADAIAKGTTAGVNGTGNALANAITCSAGANLLDGGDGNDVLRGEAGNDRQIGGLGNDLVAGGLGRDKLTGGRGNDSFVFDAALGKANADKIAGFRAKADTILLDDAIFGGLGLGELKKSAYFEGAKAHDGNDRIILTDKGKLLFDADGKGGDKAVLFPKVGKDVDLSHHDFIVN